MLGKMSKITDLMARLDAFNSGEDAARVKKSNTHLSLAALETKIQVMNLSSMDLLEWKVLVAESINSEGSRCSVTEGGKEKDQRTVSRPHDDDDNLEDKALQLNMLGSTIKSHFPSFIMPVSLYKDNDGAFYHMLELVAGELKDLFEDGLQLGGRKFFMCCLGVKGDAPFLAKAGRFNRSFTRRPTRPSSKKPATGLCHQCMAGNEELGIPFEDFGRERPQWLSTVGSVPAYSRAAPSPLLKIPFDGTDMSVFFRWDVFHNWHLGLGKTFITSAVCCVLELLNPLSLDAAFKVLTEDFGSYCQMNKQSPYHKKLTSQFFGVEASFQDWPDAGWSKGDFTRLICQWFEDYCSRKVAEATSDANSWLTALYHEGLFIRAPVARGIALRGLKFLHGYAKLAKMAFDRGQKRFALIPKGHYLHHQVLDLLHQSERSRWCPNLLMYGCQLQEDYVGRPSRISRRVSPKTVN
ncbi:unnamed protein product [Durusdinium trenchii]|uniref:Uncharacterized protein n=1 Tax=Durusdinium trenchii TaxID=1381693 RepID=A0ABP0NY28_9DINO